MQLQESGEMYLETILVLSKKMKAVRSIDVCTEMGFSKPSVSRAIHLLEDGGYVLMDREGYLTLTEEGMRVADRTLERHELLTKMFINLGVTPETAENDACRIEHVISEETFACLKKHMQKQGIPGAYERK